MAEKSSSNKGKSKGQYKRIEAGKARKKATSKSTEQRRKGD